MTFTLAMQYLVVGVVVATSLMFVLQRQFPQTIRRLRVAVALRLLRPHCRGWQQRLGRWLAPPVRALQPGGCDGCSACESPARDQ